MSTRVSVVVCTLERVDDVARLLDSLAEQTARAHEVLVVTAADVGVVVAAGLEAACRRLSGAGTPARLLRAARGLTRQRNEALRAFAGDAVCFLDDDVTLPPDFVARVVAVLERREHADVGGITAYDELHYPEEVGLRWRLRRALGTVPSLEPGAADRLGRNVPHAFAPADGRCREVGWLAGFCMIYRRAATRGLAFDESLPTYGGEDRDFSLAVGVRWRLLLCGELRVRHHGSPGGRSSEIRRVYESAFGSGRGFAKHSRGGTDLLRIVHYAGGELAIDLLAFVARPSAGRLRYAGARLRGIAAGYRSLRSPNT